MDVGTWALGREPLQGRVIEPPPQQQQQYAQLRPDALLMPRARTGLTPLAARWAAALHGETTLGAAQSQSQYQMMMHMSGRMTPPLRESSPPILLLGESPHGTLPQSMRSLPRSRPTAVEELCRRPYGGRVISAPTKPSRPSIGLGKPKGGTPGFTPTTASPKPQARRRRTSATAPSLPGATPVAAETLSSLQGTDARPVATAGGEHVPSSQHGTLPVQCAGLRGMLLADSIPLRIQASTGELFSPLDFEKEAGVLSKKWRYTVKLVNTGQCLGDWLESKGLGHLCSQRAETNAAAPRQPPKRRSLAYSHGDGPATYDWPRMPAKRKAPVCDSDDEDGEDGSADLAIEDDVHDEDWGARGDGEVKRRRTVFAPRGRWAGRWAGHVHEATPVRRHGGRGGRGRSSGGGRGRGRGRHAAVQSLFGSEDELPMPTLFPSFPPPGGDGNGATTDDDSLGGDDVAAPEEMIQGGGGGGGDQQGGAQDEEGVAAVEEHIQQQGAQKNEDGVATVEEHIQQQQQQLLEPKETVERPEVQHM